MTQADRLFPQMDVTNCHVEPSCRAELTRSIGADLQKTRGFSLGQMFAKAAPPITHDVNE
jgi:hypothetical protein